MTPSDELSLRDFYSLMRRRRKELFFWWGLIFGVVALYTFIAPPQYRTQVLMRLQMPEDVTRSIQLDPAAVLSGNLTSNFNVDSLLSPESLQETLRQLDEIHAGVSEHDQDVLISELAGRVRIQAGDKDSQLVTLIVVAPHAHQAAVEANVLAQVMIKQASVQTAAKAHQSRTFIEDQLHEVSARLHDSEDKLRRFQERFGTTSAASYLLGREMDLKSKRTELLQKYTPNHPQVRELNAEISNLEEQLQKLPNQEVDMARVSRELHLNEELFTMLTKRLEDARILESARVDPLTIIEPAVEPTSPDRPKKLFNLVAGLLLGLLVSGAVIWIRHQLDTSLITTQEIENMLQLPVLAMVPHIERRSKEVPSADVPNRRDGGDHYMVARSRLILHFPPKSPIVEVYHILRTNLPPAPSGVGQVFLFTSAVVREGKSLTAANFSIAAAQSGIPTLLVEADLRKPTVDKLLGVRQEPGLCDYFFKSPRWESSLVGWDQMQENIPVFKEAINTNGVSNLSVLPAGKLPPNPISMFSSNRFTGLLGEMRRRFPLTILDCAPVMLFADCTMIAPYVDGVILVYRFGKTDREALKQTHHQLVSVKANVLGVLVNDMQKGETRDYSPYYHYYSHEAGSPKIV